MTANHINAPGTVFEEVIDDRAVSFLDMQAW